MCLLFIGLGVDVYFIPPIFPQATNYSGMKEADCKHNLGKTFFSYVKFINSTPNFREACFRHFHNTILIAEHRETVTWFIAEKYFFVRLFCLRSCLVLWPFITE